MLIIEYYLKVTIEITRLGVFLQGIRYTTPAIGALILAFQFELAKTKKNKKLEKKMWEMNQIWPKIVSFFS